MRLPARQKSLFRKNLFAIFQVLSVFIGKTPRIMYTLVPHAMTQFVLKIVKDLKYI